MEKLTKKEKKEFKKLELQEKLKKEKRKQMFRQIGIWAGVAIVLILAVYGLIKVANSPTSNSTTSKVTPVSKNDIATGSAKAKVVLIEYSDFQCPACAAYYPLVNQLLSDFTGKIYFVYRFFPLSQIHQNAMLSSQAAYAAEKQGKFWDMSSMLFDTQTSWAQASDSNARSTFISYAKKVNLDITRFEKDLDAQEIKNFITDEYNQGIGIGINSTPTFFLNGQKIQNPATYNDFKILIQNALNKN